jgi:hypothetical protein
MVDRRVILDRGGNSHTGMKISRNRRADEEAYAEMQFIEYSVTDLFLVFASILSGKQEEIDC